MRPLPRVSDAENAAPSLMVEDGHGFDLDGARFVGSGLRRPECVIAHACGLLFTPDWTEPGGVSAIAPNGGVKRILATAPDSGVETPVRANGIALEDGGSFLLAHLGAEIGGVYRLHPNGRCALVVDHVDGAPMPPANFVAVDAKGRIWITVSTRKRPRADDYRPDASSGFIAVLEPGQTQARIVADNLGYANECLLSPAGDTLWVNETFARRLTAFDLVEGAFGRRPRQPAHRGAIRRRRVPRRPRPGGGWIPAGGLNRLQPRHSSYAGPDGPPAPPAARRGRLEHLEVVEKAFLAGEMGRPHLDASPAKRLRNISSIAFGGPGLQDGVSRLPARRLDRPVSRRLSLARACHGMG